MKFTLITGGSSGIGLQMAHCCAARGENLIIVSNQPEALLDAAKSIEAAYSVCVHTIAADLSATDAATTIYEQTSNIGIVDTLISNAGVLHFGKALNTTDSYIDFITALHCTTPIKLCRLYAADMVCRGGGKIMIVSSMTAWTPYPTMSLYGSTKAMLKNFAQSLWYELRDSGVSVTTVFPGAVDTPLYNLSANARRWLRGLGVMSSPQSVARKAVKAMHRRCRTVIPGVFTKIAVAACRLLPAVVILPVMKIPAVSRLLDRL